MSRRTNWWLATGPIRTLSSPSDNNDPKAIRAWLSSFQGPIRIALEPTSTYHLACVEEAFKLGIDVYLIGPRQLAHYREAVAVDKRARP